MEHEQTYYGRKIILTTQQQAAGEWKSKAELAETSGRTPLWSSDDVFHSEEAARSAALSAATGAIDATRIHKGKP
jgi:hypothetical protein